MFDLQAILRRITDRIRTEEQQLYQEQAVYGLDSRDERAFQTLLAETLSQDYSVAREVHYPSSVGPRQSHRLRCDMVLSAPGRPVRIDSRPPDLFDPPEQSEPGESLWLEVKVAYQFKEGGLRHNGYGTQWRSAVVSDLKKMDQDPLIRQAALVLIVFTETQNVVEKDMETFEDLLAIQGILAGTRVSKSLKILDRMGHGCCTVAIWPTVQR
ncbi:MAG: hypothetical protein KatS3mg104_0391 [Phycisphaerae bacterium]|jgi:hypothetical protein|nr:MAG: hypothetical protein KatS3mg104_0391 [Phycisphaerae bacterium]